MAIILFDVYNFREQFPNQFQNVTTEIIRIYWDTATCYVSCDTAGSMSVDCRTRVINLVAAHLITLAAQATSGAQSGFLESSNIDNITISVKSFESKSDFQWFLNQTPYGIQAFALLSSQSVGGAYSGGFNELGSFRRAGGIFTPQGQSPGIGHGAGSIPCVLPSSPLSYHDFGRELANVMSDSFVTPISPCSQITFFIGDTVDNTEFTMELSLLAPTPSIPNDPSLGTVINVLYFSTNNINNGDPPDLVARNVDLIDNVFGLNPHVFPGNVLGLGVDFPNMIMISNYYSKRSSSALFNIKIIKN